MYSTTEDDDGDDDASTIPDPVTDSSAVSYGLGATFNVTAEMSETVLGGSSITVTFGTGTNVVLTAAENGTLMSGTYTVVAGQTAADLAVTGVSMPTSPVYDIYGNAPNELTAPAGEGRRVL